jgi:lipid A ethanolaminephosphotransferase
MFFKQFIKKNADFINNIIITTLFLFLANTTVILYIANAELSEFFIKSFFFKSALVLLLFSILLIVFSTLYAFRVSKYLIIFIFGLSVSADYFMRSYGVLLDDTLFQSLFESSQSEALQYYHFSYFLELAVLLGLFVFVTKKLKYSDFKILNTLKIFAFGILTSILIVVFVGLFFYKDCASFFRNNRSVRHLVSPVNIFYQSYNYLNFLKNDSISELVVISEDAKMKPNKKPKLFVFILGETARSNNFSLNGYSKNTNPLLSTESNLVNVTNATSCGTATAASVPCLFSDKSRKDFDKNKDTNRENLADIIHKVGFESTWVENNTGCKGICARIINFDLSSLKNDKVCNFGGCHDEILVTALDQVLDKTDKSNKAVYLHMLGSHGPTYYLRYPEQFSQFNPVCNSSKLSDCDPESIMNTYDNTILYTDYVIAKSIEQLKKITTHDSVLIYVSDHGESLGENGVYLHSLPYFIAPDEQKQIPLMFWFSNTTEANEKRQIQTLINEKKCSVSHDNLFHTALGILNIDSKFYNSKLDLYNPKFNCK